ncbi:MAG TPA: ACP S-malonyltransferase [Burkholderiaceae bacterium]|nr:ACP S-malonyltransferase [Burkholderiaceae bacterium]
MKIAFVFPGQGSQSVGMLDSFAGDPVVDEVLREASAALGQDLAGLIKDGPAEDLSLTVNTQPVMLTAGYAVYRAWRAAGGAEPAIVAGHSLGEYTALTAAGALSLTDAVKLVRIRAHAMQEAVPVGQGGMAAILGLADDQVRQACAEAAAGEVVEPVNFNAPSQVVIAGHASAVARACEAAKRLGAKRALPLPVSAPFHSSLLRPASDRLRACLADVALRAPAIPLVNNVDVAVEADPRRIVDALARQAAAPVRWVETIQKMAAEGVTHVVECGPGRVLAGLTKRIAPSLESVAIPDAAALKDALARLTA